MRWQSSRRTPMLRGSMRSWRATARTIATAPEWSASRCSMGHWRRANGCWGPSLREFLDDANAHREDGYGRAQAHVKRQLPKRFYKAAAVQPVDGGFAVGLDGRVPRTPGMKHVVVPSEAVAAAMAAE